MATPLLGTFSLIITTLGLVSLFLYCDKKGYSYKPFFLFGFLYNCSTISLFYVFLPVPWIQNIYLQYVGITLFILGGALSAALSFLVVPLVLRFAKKRKVPFCLFPLIIFLLFILQDVLRSLFVSLFLLGDGSTLGLHFILGSLGEVLAFTPLVILAYKGGAFLLSGVLCFLVFLLVSYSKKRISLQVTLTYLALFFCILLAYEVRPLAKLPHLQIGVLTTKWDNPSKEHKLSDFKSRAEEIQKLLLAHKGNIDLLIMPESTSYLDSLTLINEENLPQIKSYLDNATIPKQNDYHTASIFYDTTTGVSEERRKSTLMSFSEYDPYLYAFLKKILHVSSALRVESGAKDFHTFTLGENTFAALICSEGTSMMPLLSFEKKQPDFYTLQSNLVIMKGRGLGFMHLYAYTRLIAATTGKPVFSANNAAPSYGFDGKGRLLYSIVPSLSLQTVVFP